MESSGFKLVVYAIVAVAVIALVYLIMLPMLFPISNNISIIERTLRASETGLGMGFHEEVSVKEGEGFSGETFDKRSRNVALQCNSADVCCGQKKKCSLPIEWDNRAVKFNESRTVLVTTRCEMRHGLHACTVYIGADPAQIEIDSINAPKEFDLGKEAPYFEVAFSNTGSQETQHTEIAVQVFRRYLEEGKWVERPVENASAVEAFGDLKPGEKRRETMYVNLNENGSFRAEIRVSGLEAGFEEKSVQFTATGAANYCKPTGCLDPSFLDGKCVARCRCTKCMFGRECAKALLNSVPLNLGLLEIKSFENAETVVLGSNEVDVILPDKFCPGDFVIEEPNAVSNIIGFKVKNIGENIVRKSFKVEAFHGETLVGTVDVEPEEINDNGYVVKAITVNLEQPRTYSIKLVANPEPRTEMEKNYKNNEASVEVKIIAPEEPDPTTAFGKCCGFPIYFVRDEYLTDDTDAVLLRDVLNSGDVRADFRAKEFEVAFAIQNMTNKVLKIKIPFGQIFVSRDPTTQNLAKGKNYPLIEHDIVIKVPVCHIFTGSFVGFCLNRKKLLPDGLCNVGEVITNEEVLSALGSGTGQEAQGRVWNAVKKQFIDPDNYGSGGLVIEPVPIDPLGDVELTKEQCIEAGFIGYDCPTYWKIHDPDTPDEFWCTQP